MTLSLKPSHLATYKDVAVLFLKHGRNAKHENAKLSDKFGIDEQIEPTEDAEAFVDDLLSGASDHLLSRSSYWRDNPGGKHFSR